MLSCMIIHDSIKIHYASMINVWTPVSMRNSWPWMIFRELPWVFNLEKCLNLMSQRFPGIRASMTETSWKFSKDFFPNLKIRIPAGQLTVASDSWLIFWVVFPSRILPACCRLYSWVELPVIIRNYSVLILRSTNTHFFNTHFVCW